MSGGGGVTVRNMVALVLTVTAIALLTWLFVRAVNTPDPPDLTTVQLPTL